MAKASPNMLSFNAGVFSRLMDGRVDLDRYPASMRVLRNFVAAPQGPALRRSGTMFVGRARDQAKRSRLVPFEFSNAQSYAMEFSEGAVRFYDEDGLLVRAAVTVAVEDTDPITVVSDALGASVGEYVVLSGLPAAAGLDGVPLRVEEVTGDTYVLGASYDGAAQSAAASRVYEVATGYDEADLQALQWVQSADVVYLFAENKRPKKLARYGAYDWRLADVQFLDGPFADEDDTGTVLTPSASGNRADNALGVAITSNLDPTRPPTAAFDGNTDTFWMSANPQESELQFTPAVPFACTGYAFHIPRDNEDTVYTAKDQAPGSWEFLGYDGTQWHVLDKKDDYVLYDNYRTPFFQINNDYAFLAYKIHVKANTRAGERGPRISAVVMAAGDEVIQLAASKTDGINNGAGFLPTDVGRLIRLRAYDNSWRSVEITEVNSPTLVTVRFQGEPLLNTTPIRGWRLGHWSDTTGWPRTGLFFEDRLWMAGSAQSPDLLCGSATGAYERFSQTDDLGEVQDDSAVVVRLNARKLGEVKWIATDEKGLLIGTYSGEWVVSAAEGNNAAITPRNIRARNSTERGSATAAAVKVDRQVLYIQRGRRALREFAYVYEVDGYKAPSMSTFASHLGARRFAELAYAAEPHSIVWVRTEDGGLVGLTYNRDESVIGWHEHEFGGVVESITTIPARDQLHDTLWLVVRRGNTRYIERLMPFWDFGQTLETAHYVDCGLRYTGDETDVVLGLHHLEGLEVVGLADGVPFGPVTVEGGAISLTYPASNVVVGLPFTSEAETSRIEAGGRDGTAQGKVKRIHGLSVSLWDSAGGEIGARNTDDEVEPRYERVPYSEAPYEVIETPKLRTEMVGPVQPDGGYGTFATLLFRQRGDKPLPFNVIALLPQLHTQER